MNLNTSLDNILDDQIKAGEFSSQEEVVQALINVLIERDIAYFINKGIKQIEDGQGIEVNAVYKNDLIARVLNRLSA